MTDITPYGMEFIKKMNENEYKKLTGLLKKEGFSDDEIQEIIHLVKCLYAIK